MNDIIGTAKKELDNMNNIPSVGHLKTGDIRRLSAKLFKQVKEKPIEDVFAVCYEFLEQRNWPMGVIAFDFAYRVRNLYNNATFTVFEDWLEKYVRGWGDCDDFCTHAFGELICQKTALSEKIIAWTKRSEFWMRRASAVILVPSIWHDKYVETKPLAVADALMPDEHDLVRKGYGWMLKVLSLKEPDIVFDYLMKNKAVMPRVAYRLALKQMDAEKKEILMR